MLTGAGWPAHGGNPAQTGLAASYRQTAPEIHGSLVSPGRGVYSLLYYEFRGREPSPL
jgi:hypothetical protein